MKIYINLFVIQLLFALTFATLYPKDKKSKQKKKSDDVDEAKFVINKGPVSETVYERNLVNTHPLASDIIAESGTYYQNTKLKHFNGTVLGYVTPVRTSS